jgi:hypothetical protein
MFGTVPANHRLVIKNVSANLMINAGTAITGAQVSGVGGGSNSTLFLPTTPQYVNFFLMDGWTVQQQVLLYADAGTAPTFAIGGAPAASVQASATLTGYYVALP